MKNNKAPDKFFSYESNEKRASFRISPPSDRPIKTSFKGQSVTIRNIGAVGVSFSQENFSAGDTDQLAFRLPGENQNISVQTKIIAIDRAGVCHCQFYDLDDVSFDAIHRYMLAVQLEGVRNKKRRRAKQA